MNEFPISDMKKDIVYNRSGLLCVAGVQYLKRGHTKRKWKIYNWIVLSFFVIISSNDLCDYIRWGEMRKNDVKENRDARNISLWFHDNENFMNLCKKWLFLNEN